MESARVVGGQFSNAWRRVGEVRNALVDMKGADVMGSSYYANQDLGSINKLARSGHEQAAEDGNTAAKRAHTRAMSTEGVNVGGQADAQRSGHTMNANASSARAGNTSQVGSNYARGENEMARVQEEGQTMNSKNASAAEQVHTSLLRSPQG